MVIYSRTEWLEKNKTSDSVTSNFSPSLENEQEDEIVEIEQEEDGFIVRQSKNVQSIEKTSSQFINIVNCSDRVIMVPDLFGPGNSLILGSIENINALSTPPGVQIDSSFRNKINENINYISLVQKGLIKEVSSKSLMNILKFFHESINDHELDRREIEDDLIDDLNPFMTGEDEPKVRQSTVRDHQDRFSSKEQIDILAPSAREIVSVDEDEFSRTMKDLGLNENDFR